MSMKATQQLDEAVLAYIKENPNVDFGDIVGGMEDVTQGITRRKISHSLTRLVNSGKLCVNNGDKYTIKP